MDGGEEEVELLTLGHTLSASVRACGRSSRGSGMGSGVWGGGGSRGLGGARGLTTVAVRGGLPRRFVGTVDCCASEGGGG